MSSRHTHFVKKYRNCRFRIVIGSEWILELLLFRCYPVEVRTVFVGFSMSSASAATNKGMIGVRSYVRYSGHPPPAELHLNHGSFQLIGGSRLPAHGLTMMYGAQVSRKLMGSLLLEVEGEGDTFVPVHGLIDIGEPHNGKIGLDDLPDTRFLCFPDRTKADLMDFVNEQWCALLDRYGLPVEGEQFPRKPSEHLYLLDQLIQLPELAGVAAIAYPVETRVGVCRLVTVYDRDAVVSLVPMAVEDIALTY